jgi:HSP20 family protein
MFGEEIRFGRSWDPWQELNRLQEEVNRLFSGALETRAGGYPLLRVWTNDDGAIVHVQVPGMNPKEIDISVLGDSLTLTGKRASAEEQKQGVTFHRREREYGAFTRSVQLPFRIEADQVQAECRRGILELRLPRANADKPKRIAVKAD